MHFGIYSLGRIQITCCLFILISGYNDYFRPQPYHIRGDFNGIQQYQWVNNPNIRSDKIYKRLAPGDSSNRGQSMLSTVSETLGAINTLGRYLVNITTNNEASGSINEEIPSAIYTLSKNVLGRNVTDSIAPLVSPFVREAIPIRRQYKTTTTTTTERPQIDSTTCTTPDGASGSCNDLSNCPQLLLNLSNLRQSLCFKSVFEPGVCCPISEEEIIQKTTQAPVTTTTYRPFTTTYRPFTTTYRSVTTPKIIIQTNSIDSQDCGQPETAKFRVVGGEESLPGRWPWMAAIFLHGSRRTEFWCGGTLISTKHVLTAAHCTRDTSQRPFAARQFTVRLGDVDLKREDEASAPVTFHVSEVRAHPEFNRVGFYNDIAVMVLDRAARRSEFVIPICLPPSELKTEKFAGQHTTVVGWGTTYYGGRESTVQRQAILPVWRNQDCDDAYYQPITSNFLCAGYAQGGIDACQGDSGGPLMIFWDTYWIQVGVVSFGNKCGEPGYPGVYTRVTEYLEWIKENTKS